MTIKGGIARLPTGVRNLDEILHGGWPIGSVTLIGGPPGSGKTILAQQLCFRQAAPERPALYFNTLSEPSAKTLR
jgi:circadian clock protein KaiC